MKRFSWIAALCVLAGLAFTVPSRAADEKKETATEKSAKKAKKLKLFGPWTDMASLSDEQKSKIDEIHKKKNAEVKELEKREHDAILALLNDQQKAELQAMTEKASADKKMKKKDGDKKSDEKPAK